MAESQSIGRFHALPRLSLATRGTPIEVDDRQVGQGYRIASKQSKEAEALFTKTEGLLLDPVYTSKAAAGLIDYCRNKRFDANDHVLFWHTGGLIALFE